MLQAGSSGRGRQFAGRWAELVFAAYTSLASGKKQYEALRTAVAEAGREPDSVKIAPALQVVVAESSDAAAEKRASLESLYKPIDGLSLLSRRAPMMNRSPMRNWPPCRGKVSVTA